MTSFRSISFLFLCVAFFLISGKRSPVDDAKKKAIADYQTNYVETTLNKPEDLGWTGLGKRCKAGTLAPATYEKLLKRINYFRRLAGVPDQVVLDSGWNKLAQAAALIMHANQQLDHSPSAAMKCYSKEGYEGASTSNLSLVTAHSFPRLLADQMEDHGGSNKACGHRRWILRAASTRMGIGVCSEAYALRVFTSYEDKDYDASVSTKNLPEYYAYPFKGYVPFQLVYRRWTFSIPKQEGKEIDFKAARVAVKSDNNPIGCIIESRDDNMGDPSIVWAINGLKEDFDYAYNDMPTKKAAFAKKGLMDKTITVTISNVKVDGEVKEYTYYFILFDPNEK